MLPHRIPLVFPVGLVLSALILLSQAGCLVKSQCQADDDCAENERCNRISGECFVQCQKDSDCEVDGNDIGKKCVANRCEFRFDERVAAPNFCLTAVNPKSSYFEKPFCMKDQTGKVVLLYFGLLA